MTERTSWKNTGAPTLGVWSMTERTAHKLSDVILSLTYGELMDIGGELADIISEKDVWPTFGTAEDFAQLLHRWAEGQP